MSQSHKWLLASCLLDGFLFAIACWGMAGDLHNFGASTNAGTGAGGTVKDHLPECCPTKALQHSKRPCLLGSARMPSTRICKGICTQHVVLSNGHVTSHTPRFALGSLALSEGGLTTVQEAHLGDRL